MCLLISPLPIPRGHKHCFELSWTEPVFFLLFSFHQTSQIMASVTEQKTMGVIERLNKGTSVSCCVPSGRGGGDNGTRAACQYRACDLTVDSYKRMQSDNKNKTQCLQPPKSFKTQTNSHNEISLCFPCCSSISKR